MFLELLLFRQDFDQGLGDRPSVSPNHLVGHPNIQPFAVRLWPAWPAVGMAGATVDFYVHLRLVHDFVADIAMLWRAASLWHFWLPVLNPGSKA